MIGEIVSHYKILDKIGGGGMGIIYKAQDLKLDRYVALKFLPPVFSMNEDFKQSIIEEAKIAATLDHPNICTIHEVGETEDEQIFIAMSYYEGENLREKIETKSLDINDIESIILQIAKGLEEAHNNGIIHRDIKPENIFITKQNEVKILDFGVAKIDGDFSVIDAEKVKGTIAYMSPEQISGEKIDHRTDIWAFGVLLYELLTGDKPFSSQFEQSALYSILNDEPDFNKIKLDTQQKYLLEIISGSLIKDKDKRFNNFGEIFSLIIEINTNGYLENIFLRKKKIKKSLQNKIYLFLIFLTCLIIISLWIVKLISFESISKPTYVIVSNFINHTKEEVFDYSLSEAMAITLRQSSYINVLPKYKLANLLSLMKIPIQTNIDEEISLKIAKRENIPFVINGEISKNMDNYVLTAGIIDVQTGDKIKIHMTVADRIINILESVDELAAEIRNDLGESLNSISQNFVPLAQVTTSSIEALDLYSRGSLLEGEGKYAESIELKEKALSIDSLFVKAISDLSYNYYKVGNINKAMYYHKKVLPLVDRVSEREKFSMLTIYYGPTFEMDYKKAYEYAQKWTLLYPNDVLGHATHGHLAMYAGDLDIAIEANKKALEIDSIFAGTLFNNTGFAYALKGDWRMAIKNFKKSQQIRPNYIDIDIYLAKAFLMSNNQDSTINRLQKISIKAKGIQSARIHALMCSYFHFAGQYDEAINQCDIGISICSKNYLKGEEAYFHYLRSQISLDKGDTSNFNKEIIKAIQLCQSPFIEIALAGVSFAKLGEVTKAREIISMVKKANSDNPHFTKRRLSFVKFIEGNLLLHEKKYKQAIDHLNSVKKLYSGDPIYLMAQKDIAFTNSFINETLAIKLYERQIKQNGEIFMAFLPSVMIGGIWVGKIFVDSHYELGLLFAKRKDKINSLKYLKKTLELWSNVSFENNKIKNINNALAELK